MIHTIASLSLILGSTRAYTHGSGGPSSLHYEPCNLGMTHAHGTTVPLHLGKSTANPTFDALVAVLTVPGLSIALGVSAATAMSPSQQFSLNTVHGSKEGDHGSRIGRGDVT